ncbi:ankyrin repeat-containing protein ITN1-like [Neltuma alba]|uniref:ankyrin repeat-containing protein ITN1-like n=1 Tax=Neltuma alba TaxID=207710 RepID=UPI0010A53226|nr:ankyrin repeat-containing protein ITN1-like [Prosopis alba]
MVNYDDEDKDGEDEVILTATGINKIYEMKVQHAKAHEILNLVCENLRHLNEVKKKMFGKALISVSEEEGVEFLLRVTKANTELIMLVIYGGSRLPIFFHAVKYRRAEIFNLLRGFRFKNVVASFADSKSSNTLLHVAAMLAPSSYLDHISGATLQMQREMQWFKAVESVVGPGYKLVINNDKLTPLEYFKRNHKELRADGEKWMKETASSCSIVGALIVTIMFAAAITVPGGNNQNSGYPMFMEEKLFKVFLISDALSLFSSTTSVLTFLGILTSRYTYEDFLYSLPTKLIIGLSTLFLSIATMMIAFSATIMIMLQYHSSRLWVILPVPILAAVPVTLFVVLQFPLLVEVFRSTYGPGLFKKKVVTWPFPKVADGSRA